MRKPRVGDKIKVKPSVLPQYRDIICTIKKVNWIYLAILPKYSRQEIEITDDDIESYENRESLSGDEKKDIIKRLVLEEMLVDIKSMISELSCLNRLLDKYPDCDFWRNFTPGYQAKSVAWWLGGGKEEVRTEYSKLSLDFSVKELIIGEDKLGEDTTFSQSKTLSSWLN
jgi:hypothetical protein